MVSGACNIIAVLILVNTTNLGVYAIAGMPVVMDLFRNFFFTIPYASKCINKKPRTLYLLVLRAFAIYCGICALFYAIRSFIFLPTTWLGLIIVAIICGIIGMFITLFCIYGYKGPMAMIKKIYRVIKLRKH